MTIKEAAGLFYQKIDSHFQGNAICGRNLTFDEIRENKLKARNELEKKSKEELIDYILQDDDYYFGTTLY